jgi:uncharacterized protein
MTMRSRVFAPFELKSDGEKNGRFSGIASVYGVVDLHGDEVMAGAFTKTLRERGGEVPLLWQHEIDNPIGLLRLTDSKQGLLVDGQVDLDIPEGRRAFSGIVKKYLRGMSIGYDTLKEKQEGAVRKLYELKLWEVSLVTFAANPLAEVVAIKRTPADDRGVATALQMVSIGMKLTTLQLRAERLARRMS